MTAFVLDASVALGWTLDNPVPATAIRAKQALLSGSRAVVPALWHLEIANGLVVAERRRILKSSDATLALAQLEQLCGHALGVETEVVPMRQAFTSARTHELSAYDSVYLELALRTQLPLATLDVALRKAAAKAGAELLR